MKKVKQAPIKATLPNNPITGKPNDPNERGPYKATFEVLEDVLPMKFREAEDNFPELTINEVGDLLHWTDNMNERQNRMRNHPIYEFTMLVAGVCAYASVDALLEIQPEWPDKGDSLMVSASRILAEPFSNGVLHFNAAFYTAMQTAYIDFETFAKAGQKKLPYSMKVNKKTKITTLEKLITDNGQLRTQFGRLVGTNLLINRNNSSRQYQLQISYDRLMTTRQLLLRSLCSLVVKK